MPHAALNGIHTVEDAMSYWEGRLAVEAEASEAAANHWTHVHPPNVFVENFGPAKGPRKLRQWMEKHTYSDLDIPNAADRTQWDEGTDEEVEQELADYRALKGHVVKDE